MFRNLLAVLTAYLLAGLDVLAEPFRAGYSDAASEWKTHKDRGQVGFQTILAVVATFVLAMVGVVVADNIDASIGSPTNTALSTAQNDIIVGFGDMASLIGVLFIVAIVVTIIFQLRRVQG